ncbi:galactokinase [Actinomadura sp. KC06]|uniref:galactokinase n=1 Tax=Actinomadura sp. KC06 TaxID=2530369 RepID=UPI001FB59F18|nr:galactokinase [Actinomadura sp. KC06]
MTGDRLLDIQTGFNNIFRQNPHGIWAAPGRVNLIGEHTDYNAGYVLPFALPHTTLVAARARTDGRLRVFSATHSEDRLLDLGLPDLVPAAAHGWSAYPAGVAWALRLEGHPVSGADLYIDGDVPVGAGLSSSASLECAVAIALNDLYDLGLAPAELARIARRAENEFAGIPCGILDQMASVTCRAGHGLFLDTRDLSSRHVPMHFEAAGLRLLVIDTHVKHDLRDGDYGELRAGCEEAARLLGVEHLRDLTAPARLPDPRLTRLVRHVVTENARVLAAVEALDAGDWERVGVILHDGHASIRDDFQITCPETDLVAATAERHGALGARQTGGGFGGSVIALVRTQDADRVTRAVTEASTGHPVPRVFTAIAGPGARRLK